MENQSSNGAMENGSAGRVRERLLQGYAEYEERVRQEPAKSLFLAVLAGSLLRSLPLTALVGALVRLSVALVRPAAFLFAAVKLLQVVQHTTRKRDAERVQALR